MNFSEESRDPHMRIRAPKRLNFPEGSLERGRFGIPEQSRGKIGVFAGV
jgi:hypothetical protein